MHGQQNIKITIVRCAITSIDNYPAVQTCQVPYKV